MHLVLRIKCLGWLEDCTSVPSLWNSFRSMDRFVRRASPKLHADSTPQAVEVAAAAAPQHGASLLEGPQDKDHTSHVPFGDIAYGTSEWFWMRGTSDRAGDVETYFQAML